jgi:hypothetical protein
VAELPVEQNIFPDEKANPPVQERIQHPQPLGGFFPNLLGVRRSGQPFIKGHIR